MAGLLYGLAIRPSKPSGDCNVYCRTRSWCVTGHDPGALRVLIASVDIAGPGYTQRASLDAAVSAPQPQLHTPIGLYSVAVRGGLDSQRVADISANTEVDGMTSGCFSSIVPPCIHYY